MRVHLLMLLAMIPVLSEAQDFSLEAGNLQLRVFLTEASNLRYELLYKGKPVLKPSAIGISFKEPALQLDQFRILQTEKSDVDQEWKTAWGEYEVIRDRHRQLRLHLEDKNGSGVKMILEMRLFHEGLAFRYVFPRQEKLNHFIVSGEHSSFSLTGDHKAFWIPGDYDSNEFPYNTTLLSEVDASISKTFQSIFAKTFFDKNAVQTPLMLKTAQGLYISIHEAALRNYPAMNLVIDKSNFSLKAHLVPDAVGNKAYLQTPSTTPWRTIIVSDRATEILSASTMILNLNEPQQQENTSYIRPRKFVGVWWEMHIGTGTWEYGHTTSDNVLVPHGRHSANTANVKRYIDFAAANEIDGVLVEGWNIGWEDWFGKWKEDVFDFITPYPDYDVEEVSRYAKAKGVSIIMHHETSASVTNYERQLDTAFRFMKDHGMDAVKTGYVGFIIPRGEHHDGQWMVNHYERVARKAAGYGIMIDAHEQVRPTGLHRTYPNWMTAEAARGNEFNAWSEGNPPEHETILPFTRLMGGPMDYTPGIFQTRMSVYDSSRKYKVHTTLAKQLALYVTMYSPMQMVADLPENYQKHMDAFQFIRDVAVDWQDTKYLAAEPGDFLVVSRKARDSESWFMGAITDESSRELKIKLDFLDQDKKYLAVIYRDGASAHWDLDPANYVIESFIVDRATNLNLYLAPGGGSAISFQPADAASIQKFKEYK